MKIMIENGGRLAYEDGRVALDLSALPKPVQSELIQKCTMTLRREGYQVVDQRVKLCERCHKQPATGQGKLCDGCRSVRHRELNYQLHQMMARGRG